MENFRKIELYKRRKFSDKLNITFAFIRQNAAPFFKAQLYISGPVAIIATLISVLLQKSLNPQMVGTSFMFSRAYFSVLSGSMLIYFLLYLAISLVTYSYVKEYHLSADGKVEVKPVFHRMARHLLSGAGALILIYIIVLIGFFLLIIPGFYLAVATSLVLPVLVFEEGGVFNALERSFFLIKDKWWSTFGLLIIMVILSYIIILVFTLPTSIIFGMAAYTSLSSQNAEALNSVNSDLWVMVLGSLLSYLGTIVGSTLIQLVLSFQYGNLVEMKESRGLMSEIEGLDQEGKRDSASEGEY